MTNQGGDGGMREPGGAGGMTNCGRAKEEWSQRGNDGSTGRGGV